MSDEELPDILSEDLGYLLDYLAKRGIVEIDHQAGRRVTARWVQR